jgi:ATP-dependent exoDNAse (exonuclease V) alpha subunit
MSTGLQSRALSATGSIAEKLGLMLADFQKVDGVEGVAARTTLVSMSSDPQRLLARQLGLKRAELRNIEKYGDRTGKQTLLVMDETSLTGAADLAKLTTLGRDISARTVLQGDTKQHGSPAAGRAFAQAQDLGMNTSFLRETMRFKDATDSVKQALEHMQHGRFSEAYAGLKTQVVKNGQLAEAVAGRYVELMRSMGESIAMPGSIGVSALTNFDRKAANSEIHSALRESGAVGLEEFKKEHLDAPKMTRAEQHFVTALQANAVSHLVFFQRQHSLRVHKGEVVAVTRYDIDRNLIHATTADGRSITVNPSKHDGYKAAVMEERKYSVGDRIEAREVIRWKDKQGTRVNNGARGRIDAIDQNGVSVLWDDGRKTRLTNSQTRFVDHSYARTTYKEQGATNKHELLMVSETGAKIFNREAAYVAATRAKLNTEVFTSDAKSMLKNANKSVQKETALTKAELGSLVLQDQAYHAKQVKQQRTQARAPVRVQELTRD